MICPHCNEDKLTEEVCDHCETRTVICSNCGFKTSLLEYHAWKNIHEKRTPTRKIITEREVFKEQGAGTGNPDVFDAFKKVENVWNAMRIPLLIIIVMLMLIVVIVVARR
jgi:hypothetical protein